MDESSKTERETIYFSEYCNKSQNVITYTIGETVNITETGPAVWNLFGKFNTFIKDVFLPKGYPESVSSDYLEYQIWDTCQAFCSSISGTLAMRAVMEGIGVGSETATPASAAITWLIKDGTGMVGSILFTWLKGAKLDSDCKKWRFFADVLNDIAMFIELSIPYRVQYSLQMMSVATIFKALVGTAGSSTRAAIITHQAITGNIADVSAKDGSQEIFTNLFAFIFGIFILKNVTKTEHVWSVMYTATMFHLIFNYKAVKCLRMNNFNKERFCLCLRTYFPTASIPTVEQVNKRESVFLFRGTSEVKIFGFSIRLGSSLKKAIKSREITSDGLTTLFNLFQHRKYFIFPHVRKTKLYVCFRRKFRHRDVLKAYFHAAVIGMSISHVGKKKKLKILGRGRTNSPISKLINILKGYESNEENTRKDSFESVVLDIFTICDYFVDKEFESFFDACDVQGWATNNHLFNLSDWRGDWKDKKSRELKFHVSEHSRLRLNSTQPKPSTPKATSSKDAMPRVGLVIS